MPEEAIHRLLVLARAAHGWSRWRRDAEQSSDFGRAPEVEMLEEAGERVLAAITELGSVATDTSRLLQERMEIDAAELVAMCASCKRVRSDDDSWLSIEAYMQQVREKWVTHGLCDTCTEETPGLLAE